ncbi:Uncharacterized protein dnm_051580 [Desulfonema magnum]|uniref:Uncharacterized protein n=1 Tax=Desulfonema magnum TaxID=45655 RepID=A0A975BQB1_9BACT|nr:Uncharacterized protein dnm_051580 [Desulfonema magnum]
MKLLCFVVTAESERFYMKGLRVKKNCKTFIILFLILKIYNSSLRFFFFNASNGSCPRRMLALQTFFTFFGIRMR